jgi:anti-anti-sigma factor
MAGLTATVDHDAAADITIIAVEGDLDLASSTTLRATLLKALVGCPFAIIVDMTHCRVINTAALALFPSVSRRNASRPAVLIAVVGLSRDGDSKVPAAMGAIPVFPDTRSAYVAARSGVPIGRPVAGSSLRRAHDGARPRSSVRRAAQPSVRTRLPWKSAAVGSDGSTLLDIRVTRDKDELRVSLIGAIDLSVADQLIYAVAVELPAQEHLAFDLAKVDFCDSAGIAALVRLHRHLADAGRTMSLINVSERIRRIFELTGLVQFFDIH